MYWRLAHVAISASSDERYRLVTSTIMPSMELTPEGAHYVIDFYGSLMTDVECRAHAASLRDDESNVRTE